MKTPFSELDGLAQADLVSRGEVTALELVDAAIERIERLNEPLNAVITNTFERARRQAAGDELIEGPFSGVPFLLKDLGAHTAGDPYYAGMQFLKDLEWVAPSDTHLAHRFRAAGFVFLGKTNTPELGSVPDTEPVAFGPTRNPWDLDRSPGGSSGGSAAAVASGMVAVASASDGGGSIRIPASCCGTVGLKPSRGRISAGPDYAEVWAGFEYEHVVTTTVRDTAAVLDAVSGPAVGDPYSAPLPGRPFRDEVGADPGRLRVGLLVADPSDLIETDPECRLAVEETGRVLETLGHIVEQAHPKALTEYGDVRRHFGRVVSCLTASDLSDWERTTERVISEKDVEPVNWEIAQAGRRRSVDDYLYSLNWLHSWARRMQQWWADGFDLLVTPTMGVPPLHIGALASSPGDPLAGMRAAGPVVVYTVPYNITGQPAVSLPLHTTEAGLPVGVQLVAEYGGEDLLIRVASLLEQAQPWNTRRPPLHG